MCCVWEFTHVNEPPEASSCACFKRQLELRSRQWSLSFPPNINTIRRHSRKETWVEVTRTCQAKFSVVCVWSVVPVPLKRTRSDCVRAAWASGLMERRERLRWLYSAEKGPIMSSRHIRKRFSFSKWTEKNCSIQNTHCHIVCVCVCVTFMSFRHQEDERFSFFDMKFLSC